MIASIGGSPLDLDTLGVWGVDVAHHQGRIDFGALEASGCGFVFVKATEGRDYVDPRFAENMAALRGRGMVVGAYHYARVDTDYLDPHDAALEAEHFASTVRKHWIDAVIPWLDCEWHGSLDRSFPRHGERNSAWAQTWIAEAEPDLERTPGLYTGRDSWIDRWGNFDGFAGLALWQADHGKRPRGKPEAMGVRGWKPAIHQFTSKGRVPGIAADVDVNVVAFDEPVLDELAVAGQTDRLLALERAGVIAWRPSKPLELTARAIMVELDLEALDPREPSQAVKLVQGLLLARGHGPAGLVGPDGKPDGKPGPRTRGALEGYRRAEGLGAGALVDGATWHRLLAIGGRELALALGVS